jgi:hypothetical protein
MGLAETSLAKQLLDMQQAHIQKVIDTHSLRMPRYLILYIPGAGDGDPVETGPSPFVTFLTEPHIFTGVVLSTGGIAAPSEFAVMVEFTDDGGETWMDGLNANATIAAGAYAGGGLVHHNAHANIDGTPGTPIRVNIPAGWGVRANVISDGGLENPIVQANFLCPVTLVKQQVTR